MSNHRPHDDAPAPAAVLPPETDWLTMTGLRVVDGRITLRDVETDFHDISERDVVHVLVHTITDDDRPALFFPDVVVGVRERLLLEPKRVDMHDLDGSFVDIRLYKTGRTYDGGDDAATDGADG